MYGDGIEHVIRENRYDRGFNVLCGSSIQNTTVFWRSRKNDNSNQELIVGHFQNGISLYLYIMSVYKVYKFLLVSTTGTAVLRPFDSPSLCNGGIYTCVATTIDGRIHTRNFSLVVGGKYKEN